MTSKQITKGKTFNRPLFSRAVFAMLVLQLLAAYAAVVVIELYSKRSSLGCPVPAFVVLWFVAAILPSALEVGVARYQGRNKASKTESTESPFLDRDRGAPEDNVAKVGLAVTVSESVPGREEGWFVQFTWAVYYTAGTLIFSSIMLVTVVELVAWLVAAGAVTAASKMLGYKLCGYWGAGL